MLLPVQANFAKFEAMLMFSSTHIWTRMSPKPAVVFGTGHSFSLQTKTHSKTFKTVLENNESKES